MTFDEYQKAALRTASMGLGFETETCVRALGLCGEAVELAEALGSSDETETKEAGDVLWYVATLADAFQIRGADLDMAIDLRFVDKLYPNRHAAAGELIAAAGRIAEMVKKQIGHKKPADRARLVREFKIVIARLAICAPASLDVVAETNVAKLNARYPGGWDQAIARTKRDSDETPGAEGFDANGSPVGGGWNPGPV